MVGVSVEDPVLGFGIEVGTSVGVSETSVLAGREVGWLPDAVGLVVSFEPEGFEVGTWVGDSEGDVVGASMRLERLSLGRLVGAMSGASVGDFVWMAATGEFVSGSTEETGKLLGSSDGNNVANVLGLSEGALEG